MAVLYKDQGKYAEAERLCRDALDMSKRLFQGDHPYLANSLRSLAALHLSQGKYDDALPLFNEAFEMSLRLFKGDHPFVAADMISLAELCRDQGKFRDAERFYRRALDMHKRLNKGDHSTVAHDLSNLALLNRLQGKYADAEELYRNAFDMNKRIFPSDHPDVVYDLTNLALVKSYRKEFADAEPLYHEALGMHRRLVYSFAMGKTEGEALTFIASLPASRDAFLSNTRQTKCDPQTVYAELWESKGFVARVYEQRHYAARAATSDPKTRRFLAQLADARHRYGELLLSPETKDQSTRQKRETELKDLETRIASLNRNIRPLLPPIARADKLNEATPFELQKVLPTDVAVVDFLRYVYLDYDKEEPGMPGKHLTPRYLAFVVTRDKMALVDLDTAEAIEKALNSWREAITSGKEMPTELPAKVRELVWEKVGKELNAGIKTLYISPDAALHKLPWGALPGGRPETILLEDYAISYIPHAQFLLDKLWPPEPLKHPPSSALVVGGVKYDAELPLPAPTAISNSGDPLLKADAKPGWGFLKGTEGELIGVSAAAERKRITAISMEGGKATTAAVLAELPKAKYAHFATHGFFADSSFRGLFQLNEKDYLKSLHGERIGRAANNPLVMTGLVFAGANNPKTSGRGILTGESLIDLDLSGLELAVLSACDTGLGDVAGGEGTFGLQRAFHMAGARNVIASLWKIPDQSTAALMALFYRNLWEKDLSPMESLRQAQLEIYRNPGKIDELAKGFRGPFKEVSGSGAVEIKPVKNGTAHPLLWAAFTLSGPGR
jgi:CHAT domain-containing protein